MSESVSIGCFDGDGAVVGRPFPATDLPPFTVVAAAALPEGVLPDGVAFA
jgi:hypothetical protein